MHVALKWWGPSYEQCFSGVVDMLKLWWQKVKSRLMINIDQGDNLPIFGLGLSGSLGHSISLASWRFPLASTACCSQSLATARLLEGQEVMWVMLIGSWSGNGQEKCLQCLAFYTMAHLWTCCHLVKSFFFVFLGGRGGLTKTKQNQQQKACNGELGNPVNKTWIFWNISFKGDTLIWFF